MLVLGLIEAIAVVLVRAAALMFAVRSKRAGVMRRIAENRLHLVATIASPLVVAAVIIAGFVLLAADNLANGGSIRQFSAENSSAVQILYFRH